MRTFKVLSEDTFPKELPFFHRIQYAYHEIKFSIRHLPVIRKIFDTWYYTKCALWHKYNRVHVKSLSPTWHDRDTLLEHAMFQILSDFITKERCDEQVNWDGTPEHRKARDKMTELLNWWNNTYLKFDPYENKNPREDYKSIAELEKEMSEELTKRLKEIIDIRDYLWT